MRETDTFSYFRFEDYCRKCNNKIYGECLEKPDFSMYPFVDIFIETWNTKGIKHINEKTNKKLKRSLAGKLREAKDFLLYLKAGHYKDIVNNEKLTTSGREIGFLYNTYIYKKIGQEACDEAISLDKYPDPPITSIIKMINDPELSCIKEISTKPFY